METLENAIKIGENDFRDISINKKALPKSITSNEKYSHLKKKGLNNIAYVV